MATSSLLELTKPLKWRQFPPHLFFARKNFSPALSGRNTHLCLTNRRGLVSVKLCLTRFIPTSGTSTAEQSRSNIFEVIAKLAETVIKSFEELKKPAIVAVILGLLLAFDPCSALAVTGGRVGGSRFSSRSSSSSSSTSYTSGKSSSSPSSSSSSTSYSKPKTSSSSSYSRPSYSETHHEPSPSSSSYTVHHKVKVEPVFPYSAPHHEQSYSSWSSPMVPQRQNPVGVYNTIGLITLAGSMVAVVVLLSKRDKGEVSTAIEKTSVLKLQVGLSGMCRTLQQELNHIAETADTSTAEGLSYVLTEATLVLLRHHDYCISSYSSVDLKQNIEDVEERFNKLCIEERAKFDEETLVNVNNVKRKSTASQNVDKFSNKYIVVTILVAAEGVHKVAAINGSGDLTEALQKLGSIPISKILAVEVSWAPQNEKDTLSESQLLEDYPLLRPL